MISKRLCIALLCVLAVLVTGYAQVSSKDKKPAPEQPAAKQETTLPATDGKEKKQETAKPAVDAKTPKQETTKPPKPAAASGRHTSGFRRANAVRADQPRPACRIADAFAVLQREDSIPDL